jgi:hypothetical protein
MKNNVLMGDPRFRLPTDAVSEGAEMVNRPPAPPADMVSDSPGLVQIQTPDPEPEKTNFLPWIIAGAAAYFLFFKKR